ncbi:MAG: hypothetical protein ACRC46_07175 [Thermoguttaceae bacterium]
MNFIGKLLVGLICVMSIIFMAFALVVYQTHTNWKQEHTKVSDQLKTKQQEYTALQSAKQALEADLQDELTRKGTAIDALNTAVAKMTSDLEALEKDRQQLLERQQAGITAVVLAHENLSQYRSELEKFRVDMRAAQEAWAKQQTALINKTDEAHDLALKLATYRAVGEKLAQDYRDAVDVLKKFGLKPIPSLYQETPPQGLEGIITEVRPNGWVEISVGTDAGLVKGQRLDVSRDANGQSVYVGKIEVVRTEPDKAACIILPEYRRGTVQRDDTVGYIDMTEPVIK